jgi:DNA-binding NarL/FixJ family response regulator
MNVLIAEDNAAYRQSLHQVLTGRFPFMQITETADGKDTLHLALARNYDLVFLDIRLPQGNGLDLTRAIKAVCANSIICVITSHDLPEYRDAAFRNGADRFMVKGDSTEEEIAAMVESLLQARFRTLILVGDTPSRKQLATLLAARWPVMVLVEAAHVTEGIGKAAALRPDLVLLALDWPDIRLDEVIRYIKEVSAQARFVGMTTDDLQVYRARAMGWEVDYFVPLGPAGHPDLVTIVKALQPDTLQH